MYHDLLPAHLTRYRPSPRALARIYEMPRETRTLDDWHRVRHNDLPAFGDAALTIEARRVSARLDVEPDRYVRAWLLARLDAVAAERRRRRAPARPAEPDFGSGGLSGTDSLRGLRFAAKSPEAVTVLASGATLTPVRGGGRRGR